MLISVANFSSLVNAVTSIELPTIVTENTVEETIATNETVSQQATEPETTETVAEKMD